MSEKPPERIFVYLERPLIPGIEFQPYVIAPKPGQQPEENDFVFISAAAIRELEEKLHHRIDSLKMLGVTDTRRLEWCAMELGELLEGKEK